MRPDVLLPIAGYRSHGALLNLMHESRRWPIRQLYGLEIERQRQTAVGSSPDLWCRRPACPFAGETPAPQLQLRQIRAPTAIDVGVQALACATGGRGRSWLAV